MIEVEIWSDFVCPFCCIGKRNFEKALSQFSQSNDVRVIYKSFELDSTAAKSQKISISTLLAKKYGKTEQWARDMNLNVVRMAADTGVHFEMDKIIPTNSFDAHRVDHLAIEKNLQPQWQDRMFSAYFSEGLDIADHQVLRESAIKIGLSSQDVDRLLNSKNYEENVRRDQALAQEFQIQGVPFFVFNRKTAISGAQPVETFLELLEQSLRDSFL